MRKVTLLTAILSLAVLLFAPSGIHAADNGVLPFSFSAGTPAKASEVNENFQFVNHGNLVLIDGTGAELGTVIGSPGDYSIYYMNNNGFIVYIAYSDFQSPLYNPNVITILETTFYYTTSDCTGSAYVSNWRIVFQGTVYSSNGSLYYSPKNAGLPVLFNYNSYYFASNCAVSSGTTYAYPVFLNDPSITGESSITKTPPLRIIRRTP